MDPLSALSIAAAVVQFVQFGCSLVSKTHQYHDSASGNLPEHVGYEVATTRIVELTERIKSSASRVTFEPEEKAIEAVCQTCSEISRELLARIHKLRLQPGIKERKWRSFRQALKTIWARDEMKIMEERLLTCRKELDSQLIASIWKQVSALKLDDSRVFASLEPNNQLVIDTLLESRDLLKETLNKQTQLLVQTERAEHIKTCSSISGAAESKTAGGVKYHLLQSLKFPAMNERRDSICEAHHKTFEWIFEDPVVGGKPWSNFADWLKQGRGVYWINGKAGSGKSTLMREIVDNPKTLENIKVWSQGLPTKIVSFFFWNSGTNMQRSQVGLFRSLLYEALQDQPDLVPYVFPLEVERGQDLLSVNWDWTLSKLQQGFARLTKFATTSLKLCFFIDGLDEYEGDHESLAGFFTSLSSASHVKLCVSSRPWLIFEEAFTGSPGLRLQDLTFNDIVSYVNDRLQDHQKMLDLARKNPVHAWELVGEIVTKANGVFLWVTLVVRSLVKGLRNGDDISDLRRRLKDLPADLGPFYTHMLDQIEPLYKRQAAQIFQTYRAMVAVQGSDGKIDPLELNLAVTASPPYDLYRSWSPMKQEEYRSKRDEMDLQLKSRCAGLLEITEQKPFFLANKSFFKVSYLHRTVRDFLDTEEVNSVLLSDTASIPNFEPNAWVLMSYITRLRRSIFLTYNDRDDSLTDPAKIADRKNYNIWRTGHIALLYAAKAAKAGDRTYEAMIDVLDQTVNGYWQGCSGEWRDGNHLIKGDQVIEWDKYLKPCRWRNSLLTKAIDLGMCSYVERILRWNRTLPASKPGLPLLDYALIPRNLDGEISGEMVELLLKYGANLNQTWDGFTTWQRVLEWVHGHNWDRPDPIGCTPYFTLMSWAKILKLLLQNGANPLATCARNHTVSVNPGQKSHQVLDVINDIFKNKLPHEAHKLRFIFQEQMKAHDKLRITQPFQEFKGDRNGTKRPFSGNEELNSRKRRQHPDPSYFHSPPRPRVRYMHSAPKGSRCDS